MLKMNRLFYGISFLLLVCGAYRHTEVSAQQSSRQADPLKSYTSCQFEDELEIVKVDHIVKKKNEPRAVQTAKGEKEISRIGSYRVMVQYPKADYFFANIRPEKSLPERYAKDKETAIEGLKHSVATAKFMESGEPASEIYNGFEVYKSSRTVIEIYDEKGAKIREVNTIGIDILFSDIDQTITTVYYFNTRTPKNRGFQTVAEWRVLRERFLNQYTRCINSNSGR
jgi:hypothetical protein